MSFDEQAIRERLATATLASWEVHRYDGDRQYLSVMPEDVRCLLAEIDRLRGELAAVRELHRPYGPMFGGVVCRNDGQPWPCATSLAAVKAQLDTRAAKPSISCIKRLRGEL